jgi:hypothetical protein
MTATTMPRTTLVVTHHRDDTLQRLAAGGDSAALVCAPGEAASVLGHVAVDLLMILDDVSILDRALLEGELTAATAVLATPSVAPAPVARVRRASTWAAPLFAAA